MTEILKKTETLEFVVDDGEAEVEYRLTFGACNGYQKALFDRYRERAFGIIADEHPVTYDEKEPLPGSRKRYIDSVKEMSPHEQDMAESKLNAMILHAASLASLKRVEVKSGDEWVDGKLPEFWYNLSEAAEQLSSDLSDALLVRTFMVNPPRLFGFLTDTLAEKKVLRVSAPKSES